ncbi:protein arginine N-methyltransferase 2 isoform X2 [Oncorhynchus keta]|uniref:protein arginine N-methyltransferase 2 isoform X2 n=1 Tax=Oncorhynchus keta TaxID=8018 RepID=UPI00227ABB58|nr:protein arginine N-methyltransferase 2 isoform X2 [Oncorhynchus keta]
MAVTDKSRTHLYVTSVCGVSQERPRKFQLDKFRMHQEDEDYTNPPEEFIGLSDFTSCGSDQLSFRAGDRLLVHTKTSADWWWAELGGLCGYVPSSYLKQDVEDSYLKQGVEEDTSEETSEDPWQDEEYFGSYGTLRLQLEMLSDRARTETYRQVILTNSAPLRGKVVMDLGCGTGVISLFCARLAQPKAVYAVEASSIAEHTETLVRQNGCEEVVTVFQGRAEELELPGTVDILISEWMGNCLLFEFMVESVLQARDRWLRDGGMMWPSGASLCLVPCQALDYYTERMGFWEQPYGLDFTALQSLAQSEFFSRPRFSHLLQPEDCLATPCDVITLDMLTLHVTDLELRGQFTFIVEKAGTFHGFTSWFKVQFQSLERDKTTLELDTGPYSEPTHWKQTLFMLDGPISLLGGETVSGIILLHRNPVWRRHMTVTIQWRISSTEETGNCMVQTKSFPMWR